MRFKKLLAVLIIGIIPFVTVGQLPVSEAEANFGKWFDRVTGIENLPLMNGDVYRMQPRARTSHPFFISKFFAPGSLTTSSQHYADLLLVFDIESEILVLKHPDSSRWDGIALDMHEVKTFEVHNHRFQRFDGSGFYDVLYDGDSLSLIAKRKKEVKTAKEGIYFDETINYFIRYDAKNRPLRNVRALKHLFPNHYDTLKKIRRKEKVRFSPKHEAGMVDYFETVHNVIFP